MKRTGKMADFGAIRAEVGGVLSLAVPVVAGLAASTLIGVTNSLMLAPLGPVPLAAVALTNAVLVILIAGSTVFSPRSRSGLVKGMVEVFDRHEVTFVSVTQSFKNTTSMGRLTLNILLSFSAQGFGGQRLYIVPDLDLVVVVVAGLYRTPAQDTESFKLFDRFVLTSIRQ